VKAVSLRRSIAARERYAALFAIALVAFLIGVAQVWPPGAWILGGIGGMAFALLGLAGGRAAR
jgi:hypothetical protein